jgi:hypothetical protein
MDAGLLKTLGQTLGVGGLGLGIFFLLFRELIRKSIFPKLSKHDAYNFLRLISILVWSVAVIGIGAWIFGDRLQQGQQRSLSTTGPQSPIVQDTKGNVQMEFSAPPSPAPK